MTDIESTMHEIRLRFVRGLLAGMGPRELHEFVTGDEEPKRNAA